MIAVNKAQQSNLDNVNTQLNAIYKGLWNQIVDLREQLIANGVNVSHLTRMT
jgi:uncharacterized protein involved in propanediol utilization